jgi:integrase
MDRKMPRRAKGPRLDLDPKRNTWSIRDGANYVRTGCIADEAERAQKLLAEYIVSKYAPANSPAPPVADILIAYLRDKVPHMKSRSAKYNISNLEKWWGDKSITDVNAVNCRAYAATRPQSAARSDLDKLAAAIKHWHAEYGPLDRMPVVVKPPRNAARERWLTRSEAARLLWAARRTEHLKRFILLGLYTGSRSGVIKCVEWSWIDFEAGAMRRRAPGSAETANKRTPPLRIPRKLMHFLRRWHKIDASLVKQVVHYDGKPIKRDLHTAWDNACKRAKLTGVTPHTLRHTRATWMVQRGVAPWQAAGFLGMTVRVLESTYGHHSPDWQRDAADI